jgi:hypothetical protein
MGELLSEKQAAGVQRHNPNQKLTTPPLCDKITATNPEPIFLGHQCLKTFSLWSTSLATPTA